MTPVRWVLDPEITPRLREELAGLWSEVVEAGGAVGFPPGTGAAGVLPELDRHLAGIGAGTTRLLLGVDEAGGPAATAFIVHTGHALMGHWVWLKTVMVRPAAQGAGAGRELMAEAERAIRGFGGIRAIRLTCRGGMGLERFYAACGYKEVGRVPDAIAVGGGELRDDVMMWRPLD
ncbi:GNAT family N-acetyltransferase [Streptomyces carpaticus]|uniref:GNAT family N-acetyltransferase n=1 Tax=Streptomyces TaxID=1883 RepID=UPI001FE3E008|nr:MULTISPECIES: GNAT family N-acetyltransferase [Streptomyces]UWM49774.1 GNAT family N-acetyltransferase [Streptomyces carpaticus]